MGYSSPVIQRFKNVIPSMVLDDISTNTQKTNLCSTRFCISEPYGLREIDTQLRASIAQTPAGQRYSSSTGR